MLARPTAIGTSRGPAGSAGLGMDRWGTAVQASPLTGAITLFWLANPDLLHLLPFRQGSIADVRGDDGPKATRPEPLHGRGKMTSLELSFLATRLPILMGHR